MFTEQSLQYHNSKMSIETTNLDQSQFTTNTTAIQNNAINKLSQNQPPIFPTLRTAREGPRTNKAWTAKQPGVLTPILRGLSKALSSRDFNRNFLMLEGYRTKSNLISSLAFISNKSSAGQFPKTAVRFCKDISGIYDWHPPLTFISEQGSAPLAPSLQKQL